MRRESRHGKKKPTMADHRRRIARPAWRLTGSSQISVLGDDGLRNFRILQRDDHVDVQVGCVAGVVVIDNVRGQRDLGDDRSEVIANQAAEGELARRRGGAL